MIDRRNRANAKAPKSRGEQNSRDKDGVNEGASNTSSSPKNFNGYECMSRRILTHHTDGNIRTSVFVWVCVCGGNGYTGVSISLLALLGQHLQRAKLLSISDFLLSSNSDVERRREKQGEEQTAV